MDHRILLVVLLSVLLCTALCMAVFAAEDGMTFTAYDIYTMDAICPTPRTYEAWVKIPQDWNSRGVILGNWHTYGFGVDFEILEDGTPRVVYCRKALGSTQTTAPLAFGDVNLKTGEWTFLAITEDQNVVSCYVNGELRQTLNTTVTKRTFTDPLTLNGDDRALGNCYWFRGALRSVAIYEDCRTAAEVAADMTAPDLSDAGLIAAYDLSETQGASVLPDLAGNYGLTRVDRWKDSVTLPDYAYSMALIGDLQFLNYFAPDRYADVFDYLAAQKDKQNIVYVAGLGDVTQSKNDPAEFATAAAGYAKLDGKVLYSVARGNHDNPGPFDSSFGTTAYTATLEGTFGDTIANSYRTFRAGKTDYLAITLDYGPSDAVLAWARALIEEHPTHKVILNTHSFMWRGNYLQDTTVSPAPTAYGFENDGVDIWNELASRYENVVLVCSGHFDSPSDGVYYTKLTGAHGNVVTAVELDPEAMEHYSPEDPIGMVEMLYFNEDGDEVTAVCYSTIRGQYYGEPVTFPLGETDNDTIGTAEELVAVMQDPTKWSGDINLRADIDLTGYAQNPIGNETTPFTGSFNGNGHTVSGISISGSTYVGLIGYMTSGRIRDLTVSGSVTATGNYCGGICGYAGTGTVTIENCRNLCNVTGFEYVGGICGYLRGTDSASSGTPKSLIRNCQNDGTVCSDRNGQTDIGGIVGIIWNVGGISDCFNNALVTSTVSTNAKAYTGGICGRTQTYGKITNCYNAVAPTVPKAAEGFAYCRAITGYPAAKNASNNFYKDGLGMSDANSGTVYSADKFATLNANDYWVGTSAPMLAAFHTHTWGAGAEILAPTCTEPGEFGYTCTECGAVNAIEEDPLGHTTSSGFCTRCGKLVGDLHITCAEDLIFVMQTPEAWTTKILLDDDIDLTGYAQNPIGNTDTPFTGTLDGCGHTVSGVDLYGETYVALIGKMTGGCVKNLTLRGNVTATGNYAAGFVAYAGTDPCTIENCHNLCSVTGNEYVGGICGYLYGKDSSTSGDPLSVLSNCQNSGVICATSAGDTDLGGIVGLLRSVGGVEDCYNCGKVIALNSTTNKAYSGGICGRTYSFGKIQRSYNDGEVTAPMSATSYCRALVGYPSAKNYANNFYKDGCAADPTYGTVFTSADFGKLNGNGKWTNTAQGPVLTAFADTGSECAAQIVLTVGAHKAALLTTVDSLNHKSVTFRVNVDGEIKTFTTDTVYTAVNCNALSYTAGTFGESGYVAGILIEDLPDYDCLTFTAETEDN